MALTAENKIIIAEDDNELVALIAVTDVVELENLVEIRCVAVDDTAGNNPADITTEHLADDVAPRAVEYLPVTHVRHVVVPVC